MKKNRKGFFDGRFWRRVEVIRRRSCCTLGLIGDKEMKYKEGLLYILLKLFFDKGLVV